MAPGPFTAVWAQGADSVHFRWQYLAAQSFVVSLDRRGQLAFACRRGLFIVFPCPQLGQEPGFLHGAFEASQSHFEWLVFFYSNSRHTNKMSRDCVDPARKSGILATIH